MEHGVVEAEENAQTVPLKGLRARGYGRARLLVLGLAAVVVLDRGDRLVQGDVVVLAMTASVATGVGSLSDERMCPDESL